MSAKTDLTEGGGILSANEATLPRQNLKMNIFLIKRQSCNDLKRKL